mmetsp:Transcript_9668/g.29297  ORF Transcript_9668/g.29297 Transcript_9668/m.29297 type:complete len:211 (+) Transcript_9668:459-1091(+)
MFSLSPTRCRSKDVTGSVRIAKRIRLPCRLQAGHRHHPQQFCSGAQAFPVTGLHCDGLLDGARAELGWEALTWKDARLLAQQHTQACLRRVCCGLQIVASLKQQNHWSNRFQHCCHVSKALWRDPALSNRIPVRSIEAGRHNDQVRVEFICNWNQHLVECCQVVTILHVWCVPWQVHSKALTIAESNLICSTSSWVEMAVVIAVHRDVQH